MEPNIQPVDLGTVEAPKRDKKEKVSKETKSLKYMRDKHREPVRGIFRYHECPGGTMKFSFREFKEDEVEEHTMTDGEVYTIPLGVAKHLNKNLWYPEYDYFKDEHTKNTQRVARKVRRVSFQSLEFIDSEDLEPDRLVSVTPMGSF